MSIITIHLGQRHPKAYERDTDPHEPRLAAKQPGMLKCRLCLRFPADRPMRARMREAEMAWGLLDHDAKPAWIAGNDEQTVSALRRTWTLPRSASGRPAARMARPPRAPWACQLTREKPDAHRRWKPTTRPGRATIRPATRRAATPR